MKKTDVVIIGAGPSGTASAAILQKKGYQVSIIEKSVFPRFVIGESLLPRCMDILEEADLLEVVKNAGFQEKFGAMFISGDQRCDFNFSEQFTEGYKWTWQVPRADFDKVLADEVERRGVDISYNSTVENVQFNDDNAVVEYSTDGANHQIECQYVIDASGYGRVLPRLLDLDAPSDFPSRTAVFTHIKDDHRPKEQDSNRIQIVVVEQEIWVWVIPFSNGTTSVGVVGNLEAFDDEADSNAILKRIIESDPVLERFKDSEFLFDARKITGYSATVKKFCGDRFVLTGNSTEFLDPVFSSGVTFALESGSKAANLIAKELSGETINWDEDYVQYMQQGVATFRSYVIGWYDGSLQTIFFSDILMQNIKDQICSVLAGYVWDDSNPYVKKHSTVLTALSKVIKYNLQPNQ